MNFEDFGLDKAVLNAVLKQNYQAPTPIQQEAIPHILQKQDLLGLAQTGTGKTAAFALPILSRLAQDKSRPSRGNVRILVLAPTRELTSQIAEQFRLFSCNLKLSLHAVFGGVSYGPQEKAIFRGLDIMVATPGRLLDHIEKKKVNLRSVEVLVLDEVDQMLDLGFVKAIRRIVSELPPKRQNLFFSATLPKEIAGLAKELLTSPVTVSVAPAATTVERVSQKVFLIEKSRKSSHLIQLLADEDLSRVIVFTRTKHGANRLAKQLTDAGILSEAIHGNKSQSQREKALTAFRKKKLRVLVATDIAARGIDIDQISHVINFDLPEVPESYVHRIGRTARAGHDGQAIAFCDNEERHLLRSIEKTIRLKLDCTDLRLEENRTETEKMPAKKKGGSVHKPLRVKPARTVKSKQTAKKEIGQKPGKPKKKRFPRTEGGSGFQRRSAAG